MANGYSIFVGLVVIVALCLASWFFSPKGENQVYVSRLRLRQGFVGMLTHMLCRLWRSSLILTIVSCYLMWAITFLAQLNPLIEPRRSDLRKEYLSH